MNLVSAATRNQVIMIVLAVSFLLFQGHRAAGSDLALLSSTLKTYQRAACEEETMTLKCPPGTTISVGKAAYNNGTYGNNNCNSSFLIITGDGPTNHMCIIPELTLQTLEHALLQMVVGVCQKKRQCKFNTSPNTFQSDPCPGQRKNILVTYKCRPYEFRSKVACENDAINLVCNPSYRVAIFSASFGRTQYESVQCPQPRGVMEETCSIDFATETLIQLCHGKRRCTVVANNTTFGKADPCRPESKTYLKVVYTCVPRSVLRDQYDQGDIDSDEEEMLHFEEGFDRADFRGEFSPSPNLEGPQSQPRDNISGNFPTVSSSPPHARINDGNQEKFYLYIIISVGAGILLFLGLVIGRLLVSRYHTKRDERKYHGNNENLPNGFNDDISEIDANIDLTTTSAVPMQSARLPETQLVERLHGERYYSDTRISLSPTSIHATTMPHVNTGVRIDLGNHMVGTDNLHTILCTNDSKSLNNKSYYYG